MQISITGRHMELTEALQAHARDRLEKIISEFPRLLSAHMVLAVEKYRHTAELGLRGMYRTDIDASEESSDMYASIDGVVDKALKQLRRLRDKTADHKSKESLAAVELAAKEKLQAAAEQI